MLQFLSLNKSIQRSVKSVIVFCTYDGAEKTNYIECLSEMLEMTIMSNLHYKGNEVGGTTLLRIYRYEMYMRLFSYIVDFKMIVVLII